MGGVTGHNRGILKESEHSIIGKNLSILCTGLLQTGCTLAGRGKVGVTCVRLAVKLFAKNSRRKLLTTRPKEQDFGENITANLCDNNIYIMYVCK